VLIIYRASWVYDVAVTCVDYLQGILGV